MKATRDMGGMRMKSLRTLTALVVGIISLIGGSAFAGASEGASPVAVIRPAGLLAALTPGPKSFDLCASDGTITVAGGAIVPVWGFVEATSCTTGLVNDSNFPGPELRAADGDPVTINLTNALDENVSILVAGQTMTATGGVAGTFAAEAAGSGGTVTYDFTAHEGTFLYESGTDPSIQVPMGLYGALVVESATAGQVYSTNASPYDTEAVLVLSEIDPNLNANPGAFDLLGYHPTYWLINGKAYPDTSSISAMGGQRVLVRYLNAGFDNLSMAVLGTYQTVVGHQGYPITNTYDAVAEVIPAGATADVLVDTAGLEGEVPLYNRNELLTNANAFPGGMLTFIQVTSPVGSPPAAMITQPASGATVTGSTVQISVDASDAEDDANLGVGNLEVDWSVDGGTTWMNTAWGGSTYEATWDSRLVADGLVTIDVRAIDVDGNTATDSVGVTVDNAPNVSLSPVADATVYGDAYPISIAASDASDAAGSLTVEWSGDGGATWIPAGYNVATDRYESTWDTTGLADGAATVSARATDSDGEVGTADNVVDVSNVPIGGIVAPEDGATVSGQVLLQVEATDAEDDALNGAGSLSVTFAVDGGVPSAPMGYNGSSGYYEAVWDSGSASAGGHVIDVEIADSRGNISDSANITVATGNAVHIGDLDGSATAGGGPNWTARAAVAVHDVNHNGLSGATVTITATRTRRSNGNPEVSTLSCVTTAAGTCSVSQGVNINQFEGQVVFLVTGVSSPAPYDPGANHDPDDGDDPVTVTVGAP